MRLWAARDAKLLLGLLVVIFGGGLVAWLLWMRMPGRSFRGPLPALTADQRALSEQLRRDVTHLATTIGPRNVTHPRQYQAAMEFIEAELRAAGLTVTRQEYDADGDVCVNLVGEQPGGTRKDEIVVVGAHYDTCFSTPGANDNGSGVAGVLALARRLAGARPARTVRCLVFANEEPPYFKTAQMGSLVYAQKCRARGDRIVVMLCLETIGFYSDAPGSQRYPFPVGLFYPSRGDFIAFVSRTRERGLVRRCVRVFRQHADFPSEGAALPGALPGIDWSDHWSFWQAGYPALMVTDTAPFRYAHYHADEDTPDQLDYDRLARVMCGLEKVVADLAEH